MPKRDDYKDTVFFEWYEIKRDFLDTVRNGRIKENFSKININTIKRMLTEWVYANSWYGNVTSEDTIQYLEKGFNIPGLKIEDTNIIPLRKKRSIRWSDNEGDYHHDLFISGVNNFYSEISKRDKMPGISIDLKTAFTSGQSGNIITEYNNWILKELVALEISGIDYAIQLTTRLDDPYLIKDLSRPRALDTIINIKRINETSDYREWSALLSPGGFRHIVFFALIKACDKIGKKIRNNLGFPVSNDAFKVQYEPIKEKIIIQNATSPYIAFSEASMMQQFTQAIEDAKRGYLT